MHFYCSKFNHLLSSKKIRLQKRKENLFAFVCVTFLHSIISISNFAINSISKLQLNFILTLLIKKKSIHAFGMVEISFKVNSESYIQLQPQLTANHIIVFVKIHLTLVNHIFIFESANQFLQSAHK